MQDSARSRADAPSPTDTWWTLVLARVDRLRTALPARLSGVIQFEVAGEGPSAMFHLSLDGRDTRGGAGLAATPRTWIETREADLRRLLDGDPSAALHTYGDEAFARAVFDWLAARPTGGSLIQLRSSR